MKIGIIADYYNEIGGISTYTGNLVSQLLRLDRKNSYYLISYTHCHERPLPPEREIIIPPPAIPFRRTYWKNYLLPKKLAVLDLDIVHDLSGNAPFPADGRFARIVTIHDISPLLFPRTHTLTNRLQTEKLRLQLTGRVDSIITDSDNTRRDIIRYFGIRDDRITVAYLGISPDFRPDVPAKTLAAVKRNYALPEQFLLFVGRLEPRKNIPMLIRAFRRSLTALKLMYDMHLVIIGQKGWGYDEIFRLAAGDRTIRILETVPTGDLPAFYHHASAFVYPSLYEGFGLPVLEAMACGCPVITSRTSSLPEVVGDAAYFVNPNSDVTIISAIQSVLFSPALRQRMSRRGLHISRKFTWYKTALQTLSVYQQFLQRA